jgi:predicted esterase
MFRSLTIALAALLTLAATGRTEEPLTRVSADTKKAVKKAVSGDARALAKIEKIGPLAKKAAEDVEKKALGSWRFRGKRSGQEKIEIEVGGRTQRYVLSAPKGYSPKKSWPLILSLHGAGGNGPMELSFQWASVRSKWRGFIAAPSGNPPGAQWFPAQEPFVLAVLKDAMTRANIDANRVYVNGFSNGGNGAWYYGEYHPGIFAAMCTRGGGNPMPGMLRNLLHVPAYIVHGEKDSVIRVDSDRRDAAALETLGYEVVYTEVPGGRHKPFNEENPKILDFYRKHPRDPWPKELKILPRPDRKRMRILWLEIPEGAGTSPVEAAVKDGNTIEIRGATRVVLWLSDDLVDLDKEVIVKLNGAEAFRGKAERRLKTLVADLRERMDRQAPAWVRLEIGK